MSDEKTMTHEAIFHRLIAERYNKRSQGYIMGIYRLAAQQLAKHEEEKRHEDLARTSR